MNITIIQGHPDGHSRHLCHALADEYADALARRGIPFASSTSEKIEFPLLRTKEAFEHATLPPELATAQGDRAWASHLLLVYPLWLGEMPAVVKGFFEHVLRPGFAFDVHGKGWKPKLIGTTGRVVVTMGMPAAVYRWYFGAHSLKSLRRNVLQFVGIKPIRATFFGLVESASTNRKKSWFAAMRKLGAAAR